MILHFLCLLALIIYELGLQKTKKIENQPGLKKFNLNFILTCFTYGVWSVRQKKWPLWQGGHLWRFHYNNHWDCNHNLHSQWIPANGRYGYPAQSWALVVPGGPWWLKNLSFFQENNAGHSGFHSLRAHDFLQFFLECSLAAYSKSLGIFILRFAEAITLQLTLNEAVGNKCKVLQVEGDNFHKVLLLYLERKYKAQIGSYSNIPSSSKVNIFEVKNIVEMIKIRMSWEVKTVKVTNLFQ